MLNPESYIEDNLYVGTSAAEILHFVSIPADLADESQRPSFIFASRVQPQYTQPSTPNRTLFGVQEITLLPNIRKACVLCNNTLTFYSLPELSPALRNTKVSNCTWVGGVDLDAAGLRDNEGVVIMICVKSRIRLVKIGEEPKSVKNIEFPGCLISARRGGFACVADTHSYALLDLENQQKVPLFPISSLDDSAVRNQVQDISVEGGRGVGVGRRSSSAALSSNATALDTNGHSRSTSLGAFVGGLGKRQPSPQATSHARLGLNREESPARPASPVPALSPMNSGLHAATQYLNNSTSENVLPPTPEVSDISRELPPVPPLSYSMLRPFICSPTSTEFLLITGTLQDEPGVGIFVNLDGDVVRGTLEFSQYPGSVVLDGQGAQPNVVQRRNPGGEEGYVLASVVKYDGGDRKNTIEIQRWDDDSSERKSYMDVPLQPPKDDIDDEGATSKPTIGLRKVHSPATVPFPEVSQKLRAERLRLPFRDNTDVGRDSGHANMHTWEIDRYREEEDFGKRLGGRSSQVIAWSGSSIWWAVRSPLVLRLDATLEEATDIAEDVTHGVCDRSKVVRAVNGVRDQEPTTETEFFSLEYIRQKASLIMFVDLVFRSDDSKSDRKVTEELLISGGIDPRVVLTLIPLLQEEIVEGPKGIWIHAGLIQAIQVVQHRWSSVSVVFPSFTSSLDQAGMEILDLLKRYLFAWRQRKGFGSIADEKEVFQTVDAALLHVLLHISQQQSPTSFAASNTRIEIYSVVDQGVNCFDRAIVLLEEYQRLYVLSRLYQSRRMAGHVLETWARIVEGEVDKGGELADGENEVLKYLVKIKDVSLVEKYGTWLAKRNPALGVRVFTDDNSRVKFEPYQVVQLLQKQAPEAVKDYLEHLVFGKKSTRYANHLISYYLDNVLKVLQTSEDARAILAQSYEVYRALRPPKPTYRQFITDNSIVSSWWHDRLRLLELLGGSHGSAFSYDVPSVLSRIEPFEPHLVPESIILDGRQGRHQQALRLLIHDLGDYHTAINYCLLGGSSIFHPVSGRPSPDIIPTWEEQTVLFEYLLTEFLCIKDINDRVERTSELLDRFGAWYDVTKVLRLIPDTWSVDLIASFLVRALRRLVHERNEAMISKALSGAENLQIASEFVEKCHEVGPQIETVQP